MIHRRLQWGKIRVDGVKVFWVTGDTEKEPDDNSLHSFYHLQDEEFLAEVCAAGIPRDPWDFVEQAVKVGHPRSMALHLSSEITEMLCENFSMAPHLVVKARVEFFNKWSERCKALEEEETRLHESLDPRLQHVLVGKRLILFREMLASLGYPDEGFPLSGWLPKSNVFPVSLKRPGQSVESALKIARGINHNVCRQVANSVDAELAEEVLGADTGGVVEQMDL